MMESCVILHTLGSRIPGFQDCVNEEIEDIFKEYCRRLISTLSTVLSSWRYEIVDTMNEAMDLLQENIAALEVGMTVAPLSKLQIEVLTNRIILFVNWPSF